MLFHQWEYAPKTTETTVIRPDGCRDIIVTSRYGVPDTIRITDWDNQPYSVCPQAGASLVGYRLRPGTTIDPRALSTTQELTPAILRDLIQNEATKDQEVEELIEALTRPNSTIAKVARQNGTTARTLQRQFRNRSLPSPDYWRLLGRARRAIQALPCRAPLTEIAYAYGYSDQAHMTREFVRWFGLAPAELRKNPNSIDEICQPGLGNWMDDDPSQFAYLI